MPNARSVLSPEPSKLVETPSVQRVFKGFQEFSGDTFNQCPSSHPPFAAKADQGISTLVLLTTAVGEGG
jgi:hypothetical protein